MKFWKTQQSVRKFCLKIHYVGFREYLLAKMEYKSHVIFTEFISRFSLVHDYLQL